MSRQKITLEQILADLPNETKIGAIVSGDDEEGLMLRLYDQEHPLATGAPHDDWREGALLRVPLDTRFQAIKLWTLARAQFGEELRIYSVHAIPPHPDIKVGFTEGRTIYPLTPIP